MATTFFLINCQKAPNRGVKAQGGPGSVTTPDGKAAAAEVIVDCSPTFLSVYAEADKLVKELAAKSSTDLANATESEKEEISSKEKVARAKLNDAVAEITKIKADATACKAPNVANPYTIANIKASLDKVNLELKQKNVSTEGQAEALDRQAEAREKAKLVQAQKDLGSLAEKMEFQISDALAEQLKKDNVGVIYFKNGQIITSPSTETQKKDEENKKLTTCKLAEGTADIEKGEKGVITYIDMGQTQDAQSKRYKLSVIMSVKSDNVKIDCLVNEDQRTKFGAEFRNVFQKNLMTKANIENEAKKAGAKKVTLASAKEELALRQQAIQASAAGIMNKETELAAKEAELAKATADRDEANVKTLSSEVDALKAKVKDLKSEHTKLEKLEADAKAKVDKAEKESAA